MMKRYYFDVRDGDELIIGDEEGAEHPDIKSVREEAARTLAELAPDVIQRQAKDAIGQRLAVEVRDDHGPVLQAKFLFEIEPAK